MAASILDKFKEAPAEETAEISVDDIVKQYATAKPAPAAESGFSWLFLIPIAAAVGIAGFLVIVMLLKKRK